MKTTKEKIEVMQAFERGEPIQYRHGVASEWETCITPIWDWYNKDYRVKPKTVTLYWGIFRNTVSDSKPCTSSTCYTLAQYDELKKHYQDLGYEVLREYIDEFYIKDAQCF